MDKKLNRVGNKILKYLSQHPGQYIETSKILMALSWDGLFYRALGHMEQMGRITVNNINHTARINQ